MNKSMKELFLLAIGGIVFFILLLIAIYLFPDHILTSIFKVSYVIYALYVFYLVIGTLISLRKKK